jgi:glycosyltransferase involved in cell wall biosynthesis
LFIPEKVFLIGFKHDADVRVWFMIRWWYYFVRKTGFPLGEFIYDIILSLQALCLSRKGDTLHFYSPNSFAWFLRRLERRIIHEGYPVLLDLSESKEKIINYAGIRQIQAFSNSDLIIAPSRFVYDMLFKRQLHLNSKIIPYPVTEESKQYLYRRPKTLKVAFIGNLTKNKGFGVFLSALELLDGRIGEGIEFHVYGKNRGSYQLNTSGVIYHGFVKGKNQDYLDNVDVVCLPSFHEGCAKVILEAIVKGKLVIFSKSTGIDVALNNTFLLNEITPADLADKIIEVSELEEIVIDLTTFFAHYSIKEFKNFWLNELTLRK